MVPVTLLVPALSPLLVLALGCAPVLDGVVLNDSGEVEDTDTDTDTEDTDDADYVLPLCINELMPSNEHALVLADGDTPDWIELHNDGWDDVELAGWTLRLETTSGDDEGGGEEGARTPDPEGFDLGGNGVLARGDWMLLYADEATIPGHVPFSLNSDGGSLLLQAPDRGGQRLIFGHVEADFAIERETDCCDADDCLNTVYVGTPGADNAP